MTCPHCHHPITPSPLLQVTSFLQFAFWGLTVLLVFGAAILTEFGGNYSLDGMGLLAAGAIFCAIAALVCMLVEHFGIKRACSCN